MDSRINALDDILSQLEQRYERVKASVLQCIQYTNHIEKTRQTISSVDSVLSLKSDKFQEKYNSYKYKVDSLKTTLETCINIYIIINHTVKEQYIMSKEDIRGKMEVISVYENDIIHYNRIITENSNAIELLEKEIETMNNTINDYDYKVKEYSINIYKYYIENENENLKVEYELLNNTLMSENKRVIEDEQSKQLQLSTANEYIQQMELQSNNNMNKIDVLGNEIDSTQKQLINDENDNNMLIEKIIQLTNVNCMLNEELRIYDNKLNEMRLLISENNNKLNEMKEQEIMMNNESETILLTIEYYIYYYYVIQTNSKRNRKTADRK